MDINLPWDGAAILLRKMSQLQPHCCSAEAFEPVQIQKE